MNEPSVLTAGIRRRLRGPGLAGAAALLLLAAAAGELSARVQASGGEPAGGEPGGADPGQVPQEALRPIALEEALRTARRNNADLLRQGASVEAARAEARSASAPLMPALSAETGWMRTSDPVGAFGTRLRQGTFGPENLAIDALNDPTPVEDWSTTLGLRWGVASPTAWAGRASARQAARAQAWREVRAREGTDLATRVRFRQVQGREEAVGAARAALEAAGETEALLQRRHEEGMATRADVLQARAERERAAAGLARARAELHEARVRLGLHLGWDTDSLPDPRTPLPEPEDAGAVDGFDPSRRADLRARAAAVEAAESGVDRARLGYLPDLSAFAGWSVHGDSPFASDGTDWTVGVALRWEIFSGFRRSAETGRARAELTASRLEYRQGLREARGEVATARRSLGSARQALAASRAAAEAAEEGRDLMRRRVEEGLATPSDLLQAEARASAARAEAVEALVRYHVARSRLDFALNASDPEEIR